MNLASCLFFENRGKFDEFKKTNLKDLIHLSNRLRPSVLFLEDNQQAMRNFNKDTIIEVHDVLIHYLTYVKSSKNTWEHPKEFVVMEKARKIWIQDVDVWALLPAPYSTATKTFASHIMCFDSLKFLHDFS